MIIIIIFRDHLEVMAWMDEMEIQDHWYDYYK